MIWKALIVLTLASCGSSLSSVKDYLIQPRYDIEPRARCPCGEKNTGTRIVGGQPTTKNEYPWMATFYINGHQACGATLINDRYLVTAAHCVEGLNKNQIDISLGDHNLNVDSETPHQEFQVKRIIQHNGYNSNTLRNDIALLELDRNVNFNQRINPVCLPPPNPKYSKKVATATGWGTLSSGGSSSAVLREVHVPVLTNAECKKKYKPSDITDKMLCGGKRGKDSCQGDSGGPLLFRGGDDKYDLIGITSWGINCAKNHPGVYTRVTSYLQWIRIHSKTGATCTA